jgi:hypothetical protein
MSAIKGGLPYEHTRRLVDNRTQHVARAVCCQCPAHVEVVLAHDLPPDVVVRKIAEKGWERHGRLKWLCAGCLSSKPKNDPDALIRSAVASGKVVPMPPPVHSAPAVGAQEVRELTVDEKRRVRGLLDANFDDAAGIYLDGYSDQRIATEADVPRACVRQLREASYGPIKRHPELDAIEAQIAEARAVAETARQEIATAQATAAKAESAIKDATDRLKALSQRMGVAA